MQINDIKRPWIKSKSSPRAKDPFYQSSIWKEVRSCFIMSSPWVCLPDLNGQKYSNEYCADCWEKGIKNKDRIEIDHLIEVKDGGHRTDHRNLRSRCHACHNSKTHKERKRREKTMKK